MGIKKSSALLLLIVFNSIMVRAQTNWIKQQLDNRVAVKFPVAPKMITQGGNIVYKGTDKDSVIYSASTIDFDVVAHLDSAKLAPMKDTQQFADGLKTGMSSSAKAYEFGDVIMGKWNGYSSYNITGKNVAKHTKIFVLIILVGSKGYYLSSLVPDGLSPKCKDDYFSMVELVH